MQTPSPQFSPIANWDEDATPSLLSEYLRTTTAAVICKRMMCCILAEDAVDFFSVPFRDK